MGQTLKKNRVHPVLEEAMLVVIEPAVPGMLDDIHINFIKLVSPVIKYYWQ